ncbi:MAG: class D sortase [Bryobacteraceae bacterium]|jgi:sortase A
MRVVGSVPAGRTLKLAEYVLTMVGALALGYCLTVFLEAKFYQVRESRDFARELRLKEENKAAPVDSIAAVATPDKHGVVGKLEIARLGVSVMVVEGVDASDLKRAVGHIPGTAVPGELGNVGIAGHRDTFFRPLRSIQRDDQITVSTLQGTYRYRVVSTNVVRPEDIQVLYPTGRDSLTLVTCFPFNYVGSAPKRFIVRAERAPGI